MNKISVAVQGLDCAICAKPAHGLHFGVRSCRPCAAFFRRCHLERLAYTCRWQNACQISKEEDRMACKACRFRLCHEAGMRYRARKEMLDEQPPIAEGTKLEALMRAHNLSICEMRHAVLRSCCCQSRDEKSFKMVVSPNNEACAHRIEKNCRPMFNGILERVMEPFHHLEQEMKMALLTDSFRQLSLLNAVFLTLSNFPTLEDSRFFLAYGHVIDMSRLEETLERWRTEAHHMTASFQEYLSNKRFALEGTFEFIQRLKKFSAIRKIYQIDICALMCITVCNKAANKWPLARASWDEWKESFLAEWLEQLIGTNSHSSAEEASLQTAVLLSSLGQLEILCIQMERNEASQNETQAVAEELPQLELDDRENLMIVEECSTSSSNGFREIQRPIDLSAELESSSLLYQLLRADAKARRIRFSSTRMPLEFIQSCGDFYATLTSNDNLLAHAHEFSQMTNSNSWNRELKLRENSQQGLMSKPYEPMLTDLLTGINLAKTLPAFGRIGLDDKLVLIKGLAPIIYFLFNSYQSSMQMSDTLMDSTGARPHAEWSAAAQHYYMDSVIEEAANKIFTIPMQQYLRIRPTAEEMVVLYALLFSNSAITGLSAHGQRVLQEEEHKFGQLLLRMEQRRLGPGAGAQRYMEILQLLGTAIGQAKRIRDITIYMDNVHDRGKLQNEFLIEMPSFHPLFD